MRPDEEKHEIAGFLLPAVVVLLLVAALAGCSSDGAPGIAAEPATSATGEDAAASMTTHGGTASIPDTTASTSPVDSSSGPAPTDPSPLPGGSLPGADADLPAAGGERPALTDRLAVQPVEGGVYLLGNSMFKTGVDLTAMQTGIPEFDVRFNYYDGHYTSLWYLIAESALGPSEERPELIVWGFRPRYAMVPAFRQNKPNSTELFEFPDPAYERITAESTANGDFVTGPAVEFANGFIPLTAESFAKNGLAQLVVIWRPVTAAEGVPDPSEELFVADAIAHFEARGIPYVDFYHDDRLDLGMFAKGDHYNAAGMARITEILTERIREILGLQP